MDTIGGMNIVAYPVEVIRNTFVRFPELMKNKKGKELLIGLMLNEFKQEIFNCEIGIGFTLKIIEKHDRPKSSLPLRAILNNDTLIDDTDHDIVITDLSDPKRFLFKIQIARIPSISRPGTNQNALFDLLDKKFRYQQDKSIALLISVEDDLAISKQEVKNFLEGKTIPYSIVFLIGLNSQIHRHSFSLYEIYPRLAPYGSRQISFGQAL